MRCYLVFSPYFGLNFCAVSILATMDGKLFHSLFQKNSCPECGWLKLIQLCINTLGPVLVRYEIWDSWVQYGFEHRYFLYRCYDIGFGSHFGEIMMSNLATCEKIFDMGFWLFDISIDIILTFEFCHDITIWKMTIFYKVYYIEIEPSLIGAQRICAPSLEELSAVVECCQLHCLR